MACPGKYYVILFPVARFVEGFLLFAFAIFVQTSHVFDKAHEEFDVGVICSMTKYFATVCSIVDFS